MPRLKRILELNDQVEININISFQTFVVEENEYENLRFAKMIIETNF